MQVSSFASPAARRLLAAGLAYQRRQQASQPRPAPEPPAPKRKPRVGAVVLPKVSAILQDVADHHGVSVSAIKGHRRFSKLVQARREAVQRIIAETKMSAAWVGVVLGGRDHTTILNLLNPARRRERYLASKERQS